MASKKQKQLIIELTEGLDKEIQELINSAKDVNSFRRDYLLFSLSLILGVLYSVLANIITDFIKEIPYGVPIIFLCIAGLTAILAYFGFGYVKMMNKIIRDYETKIRMADIMKKSLKHLKFIREP